MAKQQPSDNSQESAPGLLRRMKWIWMPALILGTAPSILSITGQIPTVLRFVAPQIEKTVSFQSVSVHWWAPIKIQQITIADLSVSEVSDEQPVPLATINQLTTQQPLWQLATSFGHGMRLSVEQPAINLRVIEGQTNLERTLSKLSRDNNKKNSEQFPVSITVTDGTVRLISNGVTSTRGQHPYTTIHGINGHLSTLNTMVAIPELMLVASIGQPEIADTAKQLREQQGVDPRVAAQLDELAGDFPLLPFTEEQMTALQTDDSGQTLRIQIAPESEDNNIRNIAVEARKLDLTELEPIIERILPNVVCRGRISCRIQGQLIGSDGSEGMAGRVQLLGEKLYARNADWTAGEAIHFDSMTAQGAAAIAEDGILLNNLSIKSALLQLTGNGEVRLPTTTAVSDSKAKGHVRLNGQIDLASLSRMLPQTLHIDPDVSISKAALQFSAHIEKSVPTSTQNDLFASAPGFRWQLAAQSSPIEATGKQQPLRIESNLRLDAAGQLAVDNMTVEQAKLTGSFGSLSASPFEEGFDINGTINPDRLWRNLKQVVDLPRPGLNGDVEIATKLSILPDSIRLADLQLTSQNLIAQSPAISIYPERTALQMFNGQLTVEGTGRAIRTVAAPWHNASWLSEQTIVAVRLIANPGQAVSLKAGIRPTPNQTSRGYRNASELNEGTLDAGIAVDTLNNGFVVERGRIDIPGIAAEVTGTLTTIDGILLSNLTIDTQYDLQPLSKRFLSDSNQNIRLAGSGRETFHISGAPEMWTTDDVNRHIARSAQPDAIAEKITPLTVTGQITWDGGSIYQLPLGPGTVAAQLKDGLLRTEPIQCTVGTGELNAMPQWDLNANHLQLASGSRIENLQLTPELCREWLGYVTPMLGDSTNVSGSVSCRVHRFDHFIDEPQLSNIQAVLTIHDATAAPGTSLLPLLQVIELVGKRQLSSRQLEFPAQDVAFEMRNGMVQHEGLQFGVAGYQVASSGGVGIDRRLQLALDIPLERSTAEHRGRAIQLPVSGTVDRPQIDTRGLLQNLGRQQIQNKVNDQLDRGLNKLLDKLR